MDSKNGELKLRVILDRFSVEVFVNDGEQVMTATMYTDQSADGISFFADGVVNMDVVKYDLVSEGQSVSGKDTLSEEQAAEMRENDEPEVKEYGEIAV